jgi:hypothetical protein
MRISSLTPAVVKTGLNKQQKKVPQLPSLFKPKNINVLGSKTDPQHPTKNFFVGGESLESHEDSAVARAITHRIAVQHPSLLSRYGIENVLSAINDTADFVGDVDEIGSSDVSGWVRQVIDTLAQSPLDEGQQWFIKINGTILLENNKKPFIVDSAKQASAVALAMRSRPQNRDKTFTISQSLYEFKSQHPEDFYCELFEMAVNNIKLREAGIPFRGVGGAFNRGDDERHDLDVPSQQSAQVWGLKINGTVDSNNVFTSKDQALKQRLSLLARNPELEIGLVTKGGQQGVAEGSRNAYLKHNNLVDIEKPLAGLKSEFEKFLQTHDPEERRKYQQGIKQRIKSEPMAGPKGSLNEFAPGNDSDGDSGRWYTDDELADIIGDDWFEDFDVSHDEFNIDTHGEKAKQNLASYANSWFDDKGYNVNVMGVDHNEVDHDLKWYIVGSFHNPNFADKDVEEGDDPNQPEPYDDFASDTFGDSNPEDDEQHDMTEGEDRVDTLVTNGLGLMRDATWLDAVAAIKYQVGQRDYRERKQFYDIFVQQLVDRKKAELAAKKESVAEGVAETVPWKEAQTVLNHYGADYFGTSYDKLYFYKYRKQFSIGLIRGKDGNHSVNLSELNAMVRKLRGMRVPLPYNEGVAEGDNPWGDQGNFAGDKPVNVGGVSMKNIQVGDTVKYFGQTAKVVEMSKDRKRSRITIEKGMGGVTQVVLTSDLQQLGQGVKEGSLNELSSDLLQKAAVNAKQKSSSAENQWDNPAMKNVAKHYDALSNKFGGRAEKVKQKDAVKKIASPAAMRKMGMAEAGNANSGRRNSTHRDDSPVTPGHVEKLPSGVRHHADSSRYGGTEPDAGDDHLLGRQQRWRLHKAVTPDDIDEATHGVAKKPQPYNDPGWAKKLPKEKLDALAGPRYNKNKKQPIKNAIIKGINATEDVVSADKKKLGDYLNTITQTFKKDPSLMSKIKPTNDITAAVKTIKTDDGHELKIYGNEDDGFRISIKNNPSKSKFTSMEEAVMACEMYCAKRNEKNMSADYISEE